MPVIRNSNQIILDLLDLLRTSQPNLDTKPGTVSRDLFIEGPSNIISSLYEELSVVSNLQSLKSISGSDIDKLARNYGIVRRSATPSSGTAIFTFNSLVSDSSISKGITVYSKNGVTFSVLTSVAILVSNSNFYKSIAQKYKDELEFIGITDQYAVEVTVQANISGTQGNIGKYYLNRTDALGVNNVTNVADFRGGQNQESDSALKNRMLAVFSGSNTGTELGYKNTALSTDGVIDALVVKPGDVLMTRDGTVVQSNPDGTAVILSEGTGGKVDIIILGFNLQESLDTFVYTDKSNFNDPTHVKNNFVLGQISGDENKTISRKRVDNINNDTVPNQPVSSILEVEGSLSGANFTEKTSDQYGRVSGNYELIKDSTVYAGSPWGRDTFHWISNKVSDFEEDRVKGTFNSQDFLTYSDVISIQKLQQNVSILNENSKVTSDKTIIQLLHTPSTNVTRVLNATTGERYLISNQNVDGTTSINTTGRVKISGNSYPSTNDVLQVDYEWVIDYDPYSDYDGKLLSNNIREIGDSVDWSYSSIVRSEVLKFVKKNVTDNYLTASTELSISSVASVNKFSLFIGSVGKFTSGPFFERKYVLLKELVTPISTVQHVYLKNTLQELYKTAQADYDIVIDSVVVDIYNRYNVYIVLPTDTFAEVGQFVDVIADSEDVYNASSVGNFNNNQVYIPEENITTSTGEILLEVNYIANSSDLLTTAITSLPLSRFGNGFINSNSGFSSAINNNLIATNLVVSINGSNQLYVELPIKNTDYLLEASDVLAIIRSTDGYVAWDKYYPATVGAVSIGLSNNYQLFLATTLNQNDRVFVIYEKKDLTKFQQTVFDSNIIRTKPTQLLTTYVGATEYFYVNMDDYFNDTNLTFDIVDPITNLSYLVSPLTDGYINFVDNYHSFIFGSSSFLFNSLSNIESKKLVISDSAFHDNNGTFDISDLSPSNTIRGSNYLKFISKSQINVFRVADGKDLWSDSCTIDYANNRLLIPKSTLATIQDYVFVVFSNQKCLKQTPTRLALNISDQVTNSGTISVQGNTVTIVKDAIVDVINSGLTINLSKLAGSGSKLIRVCKIEKVTTVSQYNNEVISSICSYDLTNCKIADNKVYYNESYLDQGLPYFSITLASTDNNIANTPNIGDKLRVTLYYTVENDIESINFSKNGTLYTNKRFLTVNKLFVSSGFTNSTATKILLTTFNQPSYSGRYRVTYDYTAPKQNERITIRYNYNKLIADVTFNVENTRPINADVLVKQANELSVDVTMYIVVSDQYKTTSTTVAQNVTDAIIAALNTGVLGGVIDSSDFINQAYSIAGVDRARITYFNKSNNTGSLLSITAQNNEYFSPGSVVVNVESR